MSSNRIPLKIAPEMKQRHFAPSLFDNQSLPLAFIRPDSVIQAMAKIVMRPDSNRCGGSGEYGIHALI